MKVILTFVVLWLSVGSLINFVWSHEDVCNPFVNEQWSVIKRRWHQINDVIILFGCCTDFLECCRGDQEERDSYHIDTPRDII